jgi:hypothetical protein
MPRRNTPGWKDEAVVNVLESDSLSRTDANTSTLSLNGGSN